MKKVFIVFILLSSIQVNLAQRGQNIAYIDMDYILQNVPEYQEAENNLTAKVVKWKANLKKLERHIETLKTDLANEKAILTKDLIEEKEDDITIKQQELARLESLYFGPNGDMFLYRKRLVKPIQDMVYNSVQEIARKKRYDFVFDKSSDLVMLFSNKKHDISELVLNSIVKGRKIQQKKNNTKTTTNNAAKNKTSNLKKKNTQKKVAQKKKVEAQKLTKKIETQQKIDSISKVKKQKIADRKKEIQKKREEKLKQIAAKRKLLKEKKDAARKKAAAKKKKKNDNK
ncbi:MAG: OmpH family outer membrane protein [Flavobacteriaceae bacterium]|nr:OmpH family outer membrane protein [Flavobacteriaceae bacterium]